MKKTPTQAQLTERWQNVLRVLQALTPHQREKHWRMSTWGRTTDCGTVACAAGHCGLDRWFQSQGLTLEPRPLDSWEDPTFSGLVAYEILPKFFGEEGCEEIFYNGIPRSVEEVIGEVRAYIKALQSQPHTEI